MISDATITRPALGMDVQLGMLFDARTDSLFGGASLWDSTVVNTVQETTPSQVQNSEFKVSYSLDEARNNVGLDVEGSLSLDLEMIKATGSAKYLSDKKSSTFEARVDVSCTVVRRTRRVPQETLANMRYENRLDDQRFTHFVAEVQEGGTATLTFVQTCGSAEKLKQVKGELEVTIATLPISGSARVDYTEGSTSTSEKLRVSYSGAIVESVSNVEDARRVVGEMPRKLSQQMNTLSYVLVPVSVLDSNVRREIRSLDAALVRKTAAAFRAGEDARLALDYELQRAKINDRFPVIRDQISGFLEVFIGKSTEFLQAARRLLPELRDGTTDYNEKIAALQTAVALFERRTRIARTFADKKRDEAGILDKTVGELFADGFEDYVATKSTSIIGSHVRVMISLGGAGLSLEEHPLQKLLEAPGDSADAAEYKSDTDGSDDNSDDESLDWFEDSSITERTIASCRKLRDLRTRLVSWEATTPDVTFGVCSVDKAYRPGRPKRSRVLVGDILLTCNGKLVIVTNHLPGVLLGDRESLLVPTISEIVFKSLTVEIPWTFRGDAAEQAVPTTAVVVQWRAVPNPDKDGTFPRATDNEMSKEMTIRRTGGADKAVLSDLMTDCDYEIQLCFVTDIGPSAWSGSVCVRTLKPPSVASELIQFYKAHTQELSDSHDPMFKPWEMSTETNALYLGHKVISERKCNDTRFQNEIALRIVDVAPQFRPEIEAADILDEENTKIIVFVGATGHGKSTQIEALLAYLLDSNLTELRLMMIDDRGMNQALSVTKYITCYRVRPLAEVFRNKTLLIVDTPGYGDTGNEHVLGYERDQFVTAAMNEFFGTVGHVNSIVFTCRANETRTTALSPVSTYVFQLFAKDVSSCLRTIYTFSDLGKPQAHDALKHLSWPVENGEVEVNNAAFQTAYTDENSAKHLDWWRLSMRGQHRVLEVLLSMPPIPTDASKQVTTDRLRLERKCELVQTKIMRTANDARNLVSDLGALASALKAKPNEKVAVTTTNVNKEDLPAGKATTFCRTCSSTCHEICAFFKDENKMDCTAMDGNGCCLVCKGRCPWDNHSNAAFILRAVETTTMVVPQTLINDWNKRNNNLEDGLLNAIAEYQKLQGDLKTDILYLAKLTKKLTETALRHNPAALLNYVETLIRTASAQGLPAEHIMQLKTAQNALQLAATVKQHGADGAMRGPRVVAQVLKDLCEELEKRRRFPATQRVAEEAKPCELYNNLRQRLPDELKKKAPSALKKGIRHFLSNSATYAENLTAIVELVQLLLQGGWVIGNVAGDELTESLGDASTGSLIGATAA